MSDYTSLFNSTTEKYGLPPDLLRIIQQLETGTVRNPERALGSPTRSGARAQGLMQIMPATAKQYGGNPLKPEEAIDIAGRLTRDNLKQLREKFPDATDRDLMRLAVYAYHSGMGTVDRTGGVPTGPGARKHMRRYDTLNPPLPPPPAPPVQNPLEGLDPHYEEGMSGGAVRPAASKPSAAAGQPVEKMDSKSLKFLMDLFQSVPAAPQPYFSDTYAAALRRG
jgi:hypothetical protein